MGLLNLFSRSARSTRHTSSTAARTLIDSLEGRTLLSVSGVLTSISATTGNVAVNATTGNDNFRLEYAANTDTSNTNLLGTLMAYDPTTSAVVGTAEILRSDLAGYSVNSLAVNGLDGNDTIVAGESLVNLTTAVTLNGNAGNDRLIGAVDNLWDRLNGGDGNDYLSDASGVFSAYGGAGNDIIDITFAANWTKQPGSTSRRMDGRVQGNAGDDVIRLNAVGGSSALFFSVKGDDVYTTPGDGSDTIIMLGNYANGSVVNFDGIGNTNPTATNDQLYASHGGINTGTEPYTPIATLDAANSIFDAAVANWQATR